MFVSKHQKEILVSYLFIGVAARGADEQLGVQLYVLTVPKNLQETGSQLTCTVSEPQYKLIVIQFLAGFWVR
jgi:hypothetical protein